MMTEHKFHIGSSCDMQELEDNSIELVVTSPPYPMIEMWDDLFISGNSEIETSLKDSPLDAFELMHQQLDCVWSECYRLLKDGCYMCINIGDATRTINGNFALYNNAARIINKCSELGFVTLPNLMWLKQTNSPNKFMGSGMLPCGAYVTLEHEWILILRKGDRRKFLTDSDKDLRSRSAFFWEERNKWFTNIWNIHGDSQKLKISCGRERTASFPMETPYRLINMFSVIGDTVLDPFLGTGTTMKAAMLTGRNSVGYEIDKTFENVIKSNLRDFVKTDLNSIIENRIESHKAFIKVRQDAGLSVKHHNSTYDVGVVTKQETKINFGTILNIVEDNSNNLFSVDICYV